MPESYINVVAEIEQFYDLKKLAFDEAVGRLKAFEERTKRGAVGARTDTGQVLLTQAKWEARQKWTVDEGFGKGRSQDGYGHGHGRGRGRGRGGCGGQVDQAKEGAGKGKRDKSHIQGFKCHHCGHYANRCLEEEKKELEAHHVRAVDVEPSVLLAKMEEPGLLEHTTQEIHRGVTLNGGIVQPELYFTDNEESTGEVWYLYNGASNHMTRDQLKFKEIDQTFTGKVRFGDGSTVEI
ncbi:uncharacterized protein [Miscanthus floridulus]|uniref:uncharacterized protein n=1 Tax=Miscanthus floridulus TaxID=154761 RepID=UPI00345B3B7D